MGPESQPTCSSCGSSIREGYPFCPECGLLAPSHLTRGGYAVELDDVPSERIRGQVVQTLASWFPGVDPVGLHKKLAAGSTILVDAIDEDSARRLLGALKTLKATGRVTHQLQVSSTWSKRAWNPGLAVLAASLPLGLIVPGIVGIGLALLGIGAFTAGTLLKGRGMTALVATAPVAANRDMEELAKEYASVVRQLSPEDSRVLRDLTASAFEALNRLRKESVAALAAGGDRGELHGRLTDALRTAVHIGRRLMAEQGDRATELKQELVELGSLVARTSRWFQTVESEGLKSTPELTAAMDEVTRSIDRIINDVRGPSVGREVAHPERRQHARDVPD